MYACAHPHAIKPTDTYLCRHMLTLGLHTICTYTDTDTHDTFIVVLYLLSFILTFPLQLLQFCICHAVNIKEQLILITHTRHAPTSPSATLSTHIFSPVDCRLCLHKRSNWRTTLLAVCDGPHRVHLSWVRSSPVRSRVDIRSIS